MWLVRAQNFCTSYSLVNWIATSPFSWPSTMPVCSAEYISGGAIPVGDASSALNIEVQSGLTGTRIFRPFRSSTDLIGCLDVVM